MRLWRFYRSSERNRGRSREIGRLKIIQELLTQKKLDAERIFVPAHERYDGTFYISCIIQDDNTCLRIVQDTLPFKSDNGKNGEPKFLSIGECKHTPNCWLFVGQNSGTDNLKGRPEHTDDITHDGTWHFQISGTKIWHLRPSEIHPNYSEIVSYQQTWQITCFPGV